MRWPEVVSGKNGDSEKGEKKRAPERPEENPVRRIRGRRIYWMRQPGIQMEATLRTRARTTDPMPMANIFFCPFSSPCVKMSNPFRDWPEKDPAEATEDANQTQQ